jgi:hypothetical protein
MPEWPDRWESSRAGPPLERGFGDPRACPLSLVPSFPTALCRNGRDWNRGGGVTMIPRHANHP